MADAVALFTIALFPGVLHTKEDDNDYQGAERKSYAIGLWGDLPYSDLQAQVGVPNLIADINRQNLVFTVHDGDLKVGSGVSGSVTPTTCADAMYVQSLSYLNALRAPAMFTPGGNDWTDCDRPANGSFNSLERLDHERHCCLPHPIPWGSEECASRSRHCPCAKDS